MPLQIFPRRSVTLPTGGATLREPFARGLVCALAPGIATGGLTDLVSGLKLTPAGTATLGPGRGTAGLVCAAAGAYASIVCPSHLRLALPFTFVVRLAFLGEPTAACNLFGVSYTNTDSAPFQAYSLGWSGGALRLVYNSGGGFTTHEGSPPTLGTAGLPALTIVAAFSAAEVRVCYGATEGVATSGMSNPTYGTTPLLQIGDAVVTSRNANSCCEYALIYNRRLSPAEIRLFRDDPYHWLRPGAAQQFAIGDAVAAAAAERAESFIWLPV